jgi:tellurite resistance protein
MSTERTHLPISFFSMAVGTLAWGQSWQAASLVWPLPVWLVTLASSSGLILWLVLLAVYAHKSWTQPQMVRDEFNHPMQSSMTALLPVSTLLAALCLKSLAPGLAWLLLGLGLFAQLMLGLWAVGRFWQGGRAPESVNASIYLPAVAQNFVAATASASFGWTALGGLFFGAGLFSWLALESLVLSRAALQPAVDVGQRPLQGIQVAPAAVGGLSYLSLTSGPPDLVVHMFLGYGIYQVLLAVRLLPWTTQATFAPSYWAFSFGIMAIASMALQMLARAPNERLWQLLAAVLWCAANLVFAALLLRTIRLAQLRRLLPQTIASTSQQDRRIE